jgi:hypothetical protein
LLTATGGIQSNVPTRASELRVKKSMLTSMGISRKDRLERSIFSAKAIPWTALMPLSPI